jgi:hypothetical protein
MIRTRRMLRGHVSQSTISPSVLFSCSSIAGLTVLLRSDPFSTVPTLPAGRVVTTDEAFAVRVSWWLSIDRKLVLHRFHTGHPIPPFGKMQDMKMPFHLPIRDRLIARRVAVAFVRNGFDTRKAVEELAPGVVNVTALGARLLAEPGVRHEIGILMDRVEKKENLAEIFKKKMWEWLNAPPDGTKETEENRRTAARIMAKGYIREKGPMEKESTPPMVIEGLGDQISNLTGETPVVAETDPKKVV